MKKLSIQKFSMLGLVLLGVSAVTAAVLPSNSKSDASRFDQAGSLTFSDDNLLNQSCTPTANITAGQTCNVTAASGSTVKVGGSLSNRTTVGDI
jgi:hypothetical protein